MSKKIIFNNPVCAQIDGFNVQMQFVEDFFYFMIERRGKMGPVIQNFKLLEIEKVNSAPQKKIFQTEGKKVVITAIFHDLFRARKEVAALIEIGTTNVVYEYFAKRLPFMGTDISVAPCPQTVTAATISTEKFILVYSFLKKKLRIKNIIFEILRRHSENFYDGRKIDLNGNMVELAQPWRSTPIVDFYTFDLVSRSYLVICLKCRAACPTIANYKEMQFENLGDNGFIYKYSYNAEKGGPNDMRFYGLTYTSPEFYII
jgi:hypothetical protein